MDSAIKDFDLLLENKFKEPIAYLYKSIVYKI